MRPGDPGFRHEWLSRVLRVPGHHAAKIVAAVLWTFADKNGFCYPNVEQLAQATGHRSDSRISQYLNFLADSEFVRIGRQKGSAGWDSNNYQLVLPTQVGSNSFTTKDLSGAPAPERYKNSEELAPTGGGANSDVEEIGPTWVGPEMPTIDDYLIDGVDTRPPPDWSAGRVS